MYLSQSEVVREYLSKIFKQKTKIEESDIPIYVNYSIPYYNIDKKRIIIYDIDTLTPMNFIGRDDVVRTQGFSVVVSDSDSKTAYDRANSIMEYLTCIQQDGEVVGIDAVTDIDFIGINNKNYYIYRCDYVIRRLK